MTIIKSDLPFFREFASKGLGITVKRRPDAFADGLRTLAKEYNTYTKRVSDFKEKLKWDEVSAQHALVYQRVLNTLGKPEVVSVLNPRIASESNY